MKAAAAMMGLLLSACGAGTDGVAVPPPMDMAAIVRPRTPNTALAAPPGFTPVPDLVTPAYPVPAPTLLADVTRMALAQPRTYALVRYEDRLQAHFVARSRVFGFPDLIAVQVLADGPDHARLVLWSRSVYGQSDLGVNRRRLVAWLAALGPAG